MVKRCLFALSSSVLVAALSACSGGNMPERELSAKSNLVAKPAATVEKAGLPCVIYFYDDGSSSSAGPIVSYEWNFGNGWEDFTATGGLAPHSYDTPGTKVAILRVTDATGRKANGRVRVVTAQGYDSNQVSLVWGVNEGDEFELGADGVERRYHTWSWLCLAYDPEDPAYTENPVLSIAIGDPDFDLLRVYSAGTPADFVLSDLDDDGEDDDPSVRRTFVFPHVLEVSGRCLGRHKEDVYVWKIKPVSSSGEGRKEYVGHVSLLK